MLSRWPLRDSGKARLSEWPLNETTGRLVNVAGIFRTLQIRQRRGSDFVNRTGSFEPLPASDLFWLELPKTTMTEKTIKCHICGKPYKFYAFTAADQSACPECVRQARESEMRGSSEAEKRRRAAYFGQ